MKYPILLLVIIGFFTTGISLEIQAQNKIIAIYFKGLTKSRELFLKQYLRTETGQSLDSCRLQEDVQRLLNLGILAEVSYTLEPVEEDYKVTFLCTEMVSTLPICNLGQSENTFWLRLGFQSLNTTGRGDRIVAYYQYFDRHSFYLNYATDRIRNSQWGFTTSLIKWATIEPLHLDRRSTSFNYTNHTAYASAIRFFSFRETAEAGIGFVNEQYIERHTMDDPIPFIIQGNKILSKLILKSNHLNYSTFYLQGMYHQLNVEWIRSADQWRNFISVFHETRYYKQIGRRLNWANRLRVGLATNDRNPFAPFVLDSYLNIRGVGNRVDRGTGTLVLNTELRCTLFDRKLLAGQAVAFADAGTWRTPGGTFSDFTNAKNMRAFSGAGIRLIYKRAFDTMLRIDYGSDFSGKDGIIVGIGQYF